MKTRHHLPTWVRILLFHLASWFQCHRVYRYDTTYGHMYISTAHQVTLRCFRNGNSDYVNSGKY